MARGKSTDTKTGTLSIWALYWKLVNPGNLLLTVWETGKIKEPIGGFRKGTVSSPHMVF